MALYRKYRPATFAEVVGQEHVTEPLSTALDTGRISHAYLFSGPRGCGKTSSARILARSLNCVEGPTSRPCGVCPSCVALGPGGPGNLDVIELDAASHGGVDDTRELRDRAFYAPAESRYRVFIVDEAHMVTTAGFNALLKIVEEPPAHLIFVFATTEPDKVLPTIRSRTHHYPFRLLPPATMRGLLGTICEQEGVPVEEAVYPLVIRAGGGSPRDSLSVLDQLLAGAGPEGVTYPRALALLGVTDIALIDDAIEALAVDDGAALFGTVDRVVEAGHDPRRFAGDLLERLRDLILLRAVPDAADRNLVTGPGDVLERMRDQAQRLGPAALTRYAELLHEGLGEMRGATAPRLLLEVICARMLLPIASDSESATLQRLERLERQMAGGVVAPAPNAAQVPARAAAPAEESEPSGRAPAERPQSGPPRRRGAEALAAIRENRSGGSSNAPTPDTAPPAQQTPEQRPHPAQRAQSSGPESSRAQQNPDVAPASPSREPVPDDASGAASTMPAEQPSSGDSQASSGERAPGNAQRSGQQPADNATSQSSTSGDPAERAAVPPADAPTRASSDERQRAERSSTGDYAEGASTSEAPARPDAELPSDIQSNSESPVLQDDSSYSDYPEPAAFAFAPGVSGTESHAPQDDSTMDAASEPGSVAPGSTSPGRSAAEPSALAPQAARPDAAADAPQQSRAATDEPTAASSANAGPEQADGPATGTQMDGASQGSRAPSTGPADQPSQMAEGTSALDAPVPEQSQVTDSGPVGAPPANTGAAGADDGAPVSASASESDSSAADSDYSQGTGEAPAAAGGDVLREVEAAWPEIRTKVREFGAAVHALLSGASVARLEGDTVVLAHQHAPLAQRLANPKYVEAVQSAIHAVLGRRYEVRWEVAGASSGAARPEPPARPQPAAGRGAPARSAEPPKFTRPSQARGAAPETGAAPRASRPAGGDSGERSGGGSVNRATPASDAPAPPDDDIPLPDGPDLPDDPGPADYSPVGYDGVPPASTPEEEQEMLAESVHPVPQQDRRDPDEVALELLSAELGATRLEA
ncbi:DNA polymerase III subunit gamma and tau [Nocardia jiangxiensis]|uniref:DNA-directed DNA polymerase n=1 Tax=Nocardia jiangxiensis TaxID=282685 RepID=A0ABW6RVK6_9NOCA